MIIDFHTHTFPDRIAEKTIQKLSAIGKIQNVTDGTIAGTLEKMEYWKIDKSVILNIATNPKQLTNVNNFAIELNQNYDNIIAFGSVNPDCEKDVIISELNRLKSANIKGIKLHPDYMETVIDDDKFKIIFKTCCELDLIVVIHAGWDFISPDFIYATPERILKVINEYKDLKLVAAHMGGNRLWNDVERLLVGKNVWFDTSLSCLEMSKNQASRIINNHNPENILFGSDLPWCACDKIIDFVESLNLNQDLKNALYYKNALKLLNY